MKKTNNNDFIHTLDTVYNLCSNIKERIDLVKETDGEESSEGIIPLSDNLQHLQTEIAEMKVQYSANRKEWKKFREMTLLRVKEMHNLYVGLCATSKNIFTEQKRIANKLQRIQQLEVHHANTHI